MDSTARQPVKGFDGPGAVAAMRRLGANSYLEMQKRTGISREVWRMLDADRVRNPRYGTLIRLEAEIGPQALARLWR